MKAPAFQSFRLCVYRQIGLVTLEYINPRYIVQNPIVLYNMGCFQVCPISDLKQHGFIRLCRNARFNFLAGQLPEICPYFRHGDKHFLVVSDCIRCILIFADFYFLVFQLHACAFPGLYRPCVFIIVFVKSYIAVKQGGGAVNALPWGLVLDRDYIAVAVGLNACVRGTISKQGY